MRLWSSPMACCCRVPFLMRRRLGCFNVHASLLPRWRGAAPIQRAIMAGDTETGVSIMRMEEGLDTGPVCKLGRIAITPATTAGLLHDELAELGAQLMVETLAEFPVRLSAQAERRRHLCQEDRQDGNTDRFFSRAPSKCAITSMGFRPFRARGSAVGEARVKVLACEIRRARPGRAGTVLDDELTIACGSGAVRLAQFAARRQRRRWTPSRSCADFPFAKGTQAYLMPRYKLTIEYDGAAFCRLAIAGP